MSRFYLGELEELVLLMVALLNKEAYGVLIVQELQKQAGREISISAVHAVLHRLEEKDWFNHRWAARQPNGEADENDSLA